ncbi:MAG: type IV toxin-antitoxin system AbiEi family antitoxin domain-containing protein [Nocardioides sp.]
MFDELAAITGQQRGLVLRSQALAAGLDVTELNSLVRAGTLVSVRRGVYAFGHGWIHADQEAQQTWRTLAASLAMTKDHVLSHDSAALLLGLPLVGRGTAEVHITRPGVLGSRTEFGVKHHSAPYRLDQVVSDTRFSHFGLARTCLDLAREHSIYRVISAFDAALRLGLSKDTLRADVVAMKGWPHVRRVRAAIELADVGAENPAESLARLVLSGLGAGPIETQFGLRADGRTAWCDLRVGRHVVEVDGRTKYTVVERGGFARDADDAWWEEKLRHDFLTGFKLGVSRVVWEDLLAKNLARTQRRLGREIAETTRRFGSTIEDLEPYLLDKPDGTRPGSLDQARPLRVS